MYIKKVYVASSNIEGRGVFAGEAIPADATVWKFEDEHDVILTPDEFDALDQDKKASIQNTGYLSPWSHVWVFPPENDPACFTNHSSQNNLSVRYDKEISREPYFVANRDIQADEELTNNYHEFDDITRQTNPDWAQ